MSDFNPMSPGDDLRTFTVQRLGDVSGTSGTGAVAKGVVFPDGTTVVQWQTRARSVVIYSSYVDALHIHGHGDKTGFVFDSDPNTIHFPGGLTKDYSPESTTSLMCPCGKAWASEEARTAHMPCDKGVESKYQCFVYKCPVCIALAEDSDADA